jgi:hypothetical protein
MRFMIVSRKKVLERILNFERKATIFMSQHAQSTLRQSTEIRSDDGLAQVAVLRGSLAKHLQSRGLRNHGSSHRAIVGP